MNFKQIRQRGVGALRKMGNSMPKDTAMTPTVTKDSSKGGTEQVVKHAPVYKHSGSCGNPKNAD